MTVRGLQPEGSGTGTDPSIEDVYTPATAPGLGANPTYLHSDRLGRHRLAAVARLRAARRPLRSRRITTTPIATTPTASTALDAEVVQHMPILRENWVISLHGLLQTTLDDDDQVPYFLLPSLGSGSTLRGYSSWRFRDRHAVLMSGEFRWIPNRLALDMALFYDAGMVAAAFDATRRSSG